MLVSDADLENVPIPKDSTFLLILACPSGLGLIHFTEKQLVHMYSQTFFKSAWLLPDKKTNSYIRILNFMF